jgi:predicted cupin superfamily sugar epimerase
MHPEAERLIADLSLVAHPEGGYFRETHRSSDLVTTPHGGTRSALTSILFMLTSASFSALHRLTSDEAWHFYCGTGIAIELIAPDGKYERRTLGPAGPWQTVVPAGVYFGSHVLEPDGYALVGCDVAPGFEFSDFELPSREALSAEFPQHTQLIHQLTRV